MTNLPAAVLTQDPAPAPLTRQDRCDRCSAAAKHRAFIPSGELLFCGHHARQHHQRLIEIGAKLSPALD